GTGSEGTAPPLATLRRVGFEYAWDRSETSRLHGYQGCRELRGQRRDDLDLLPRDGVRKREPARVQELPREAEAGEAVDPAADDRQVDRGQVHADLVRATGLQAHPQERVLGQELVHGEVGHGAPGRVRFERLACRIATVAPERRLDPASPRARVAAHQRQVLA